MINILSPQHLQLENKNHFTLVETSPFQKHENYNTNVPNNYNHNTNKNPLHSVSLLPSYPSLKELNGNELEYFKLKCTSLIHKNLELKQELENSRVDVFDLKSKIDDQQVKFGDLMGGVSRQVEQVVERHDNYFTAEDHTKKNNKHNYSSNYQNKNKSNKKKKFNII